VNNPLTTTDPPTSQPDIAPSLVLLVPAAFIVFVIIASAFSLSAAEQLIMGWLYFLFRVSGQVTVDWPAVVLGVVSTVGFLTVLHRIVIWFATNTSRKRPDGAAAGSAEPDPGNSASHSASLTKASTSSVRTWTWRSTVTLSLAVFLLFSAGVAMVGLTHQTVWLLSNGHRESSSLQPPVPGLVATAQIDVINSQFRNDQKQVGLAIHNYTDVARALPPGGTMLPDGTLMHGWAVYLGPYIGFTHHDVDFSAPWNSPENSPLYKGAIPYFLHPGISEVFDAEGFALSHIATNSRIFPITTQMPGEHGWSPAGRPLHGLGNTILAGTVASNFRPWGHPANIRDPSIGVNQSLEGFGGPSGDGANFVMGDGSVRFLSKETDLEVLRQLSNPDVAD